MKYITIVRCPACRCVFEAISHEEPEPHGQAVAMMSNELRRQHAKRKPECTQHKDWMKGWSTETSELETP